jgi:predicted nucleotide-binding protein
MKILIVEDDFFYAQRLSEMLNDYSIDNEIVNSTQSALSCNLDTFNAMIIDVMLPNDPKESGISIEETRAGYLSGIAIARRIKNGKPDFPIILFSAYNNSEIEEWAENNNVKFVSKEDAPSNIISALRTNGLLGTKKPKSFIVHGQDKLYLLQLKNFIQNTLKWDEPIILRDLPSSGKTIIEKFEEYASRIDYVFVLMTPDDKIISENSSNEEKRRARQNVIFELGFFYAQLGRSSGKIIVLHKGPLELPSDIQGVVWIDINNGIESAGELIRKEIARTCKDLIT